MERRLKNWDYNRDGMPDDWERANGLNPKKIDDRNSDLEKDGHTNLEAYLNSF